MQPSGSNRLSPHKPTNKRDERLAHKTAFFEAKAESARLLRETKVRLPRHQKALTLDDIAQEEAAVEKAKQLPEAKQKKKDKLLMLINNKQPKMGTGYLELNPDLKQLQDKVAGHLTRSSSKSPTKKIKTIETIKDENGEVIDIKETIIEQKIEKDEV